VFGHSLGGYIALEILRKYPDSVKAIGLLNSSASEDSQEKKEISSLSLLAQMVLIRLLRHLSLP